MPPPTDAGECYLSGLPTPGAIIAPVPEEGQVWLIQITGVFPEGEGPMGTSSDCTSRVADVPCGQQ